MRSDSSARTFANCRRATAAATSLRTSVAVVTITTLLNTFKSSSRTSGSTLASPPPRSSQTRSPPSGSRWRLRRQRWSSGERRRGRAAQKPGTSRCTYTRARGTRAQQKRRGLGAVRESVGERCAATRRRSARGRDRVSGEASWSARTTRPRSAPCSACDAQAPTSWFLIA
eukprot:4646325-Pleurochrysis_carterae.AAC.1